MTIANRFGKRSNGRLSSLWTSIAETKDIVRAQKSEHNELKDYLSCKLIKIKQCL